MHSLPEIDHAVLTLLSQQTEPVAIPALAQALALDQSKVTACCLHRADLLEVTVTESAVQEYRLGAKGRELAQQVFPERKLIAALHGAARDRATMPELAELAELDAKVVGQTLKFLIAKGWAEKDGKEVVLTVAGQNAARGQALLPDEQLVAALGQAPGGNLFAEDVRTRGVDLAQALRLLEGRTGVVELKERTVRKVSLTEAGRALLAAGITARREVNQLTSELLLSGEWRAVALRPYDVSLASEPVYPGKEHPLVSLFGHTRKVFLELGFSEIVSPYVESSFWDFDALFQPQDHPARDMQDTFYVGRPASCALPDAALVERVRRTHENGGDTGSVGWRYAWDRSLAQKPVLRTHTTATTIRALAENPNPPRKVFCVGPVFRRETVDYKHLPVFHQVDGIVIDKDASFAALLGILSAFYRKMGFDRYQFRPAFFPYTEPSVEIFVWADKKKDWIEMGGAGVFRPEVTEPLGCTVPVLAWGLGLERLAIFRYDLSSISELYRARLSWLKEAPLCR